MTEKSLEREILSKLLLVDNLQNKVASLEARITNLGGIVDQLVSNIMAKKNKSHKESRALLLHHLKKCKASVGMTPTFTRRELITAGVIPEMGSDTFRKCVLKGDFEIAHKASGKPTTYRVKKGVVL